MANPLIPLQVQNPDFSGAGNALFQGLSRGPEQKLRNQLLTTKNQQADMDFQLKDMAIDAIQIKPMLEEDNLPGVISALEQRAVKITQRDGDPSHTLGMRDGLKTGKITPAQASSELDAVMSAAQQAGVLKNEGMTDYQRQNLDLQRMRLGAQNGDPAAVKEYKYFQGLDEEQKKQFLLTRRAGSYFDKNDVRMNVNPLNNTAQPIQEVGLTQTQPEIQQELTQQSAKKAATEKAAETAIKKSEEAFDRIAPIRQNIANYDEAIRLIDEGANTGVIQSKLPSFKQASQELDNLQGRLGLDVIGNTTFGALSESELKFALSTALPKNLEGPALKEWIQRKKTSQQKLLSYVQQAATYLGTPGNTVAGWVGEQKQQALSKIPPQAIKFLNSNPGLSDQFMEKYGVLPDGF